MSVSPAAASGAPVDVVNVITALGPTPEPVQVSVNVPVNSIPCTGSVIDSAVNVKALRGIDGAPARVIVFDVM